MKIAILGAGQIGSTFALYLGRKGHEVTMVARGARLAELQRAGAIVPVEGAPAKIAAEGSLDPAAEWDLVLVTVRAQQLDSVLPALAQSRAKKILFMCNTVEPLERFRSAVGAARAAFGFPTMTAAFVDGRLSSRVEGPGMSTVLDDAALAAVLEEAGLPTQVSTDMEAFLRNHAAWIVPLMAAGLRVSAKGGGLSWAEAGKHARAIDEGFAVVRGLGHPITPQAIATFAAVPTLVRTAVIWAASRTPVIRALAGSGPDEARALIDGMAALAKGPVENLRAIRP